MIIRITLFFLQMSPSYPDRKNNQSLPSRVMTRTSGHNQHMLGTEKSGMRDCQAVAA